MGFVGGRGGGGRKVKPSKVGSKVRRANKKAAEQGPRDAEMLVPGGGKMRAEGVDLETVDWDKVGGWSKVKYDPNRLIFGAQEEGFVELEEIDMNDLDLSKLVPAPSKGVGASRGGPDGAKSRGGFETVDLADFDDHDGDFGEEFENFTWSRSSDEVYIDPALLTAAEDFGVDTSGIMAAAPGLREVTLNVKWKEQEIERSASIVYFAVEDE